MKKVIASLMFLFVSSVFSHCYSQSMVTEISWMDVEQTTYQGLLVLYPNNQGHFRVKFYHPVAGWVWVGQNATLTNQYDMYGNCTSFINCSYPQTSPYVPYSADNFIVYPNGTMYTQDYQGKWSTRIVARVIQPVYWQSKFSEYGLSN